MVSEGPLPHAWSQLSPNTFRGPHQPSCPHLVPILTPPCPHRVPIDVSPSGPHLLPILFLGGNSPQLKPHLSFFWVYCDILRCVLSRFGSDIV